MRRTILLTICVFLLGLMTVVGVSTWKLQAIRDSIAAERDGSIALHRLGGDARHEVQALSTEVGRLFTARTPADLEAGAAALERDLAALAGIVDRIGDVRFAPLIAQPSVAADGRPGPSLQEAVTV